MVRSKRKRGTSSGGRAPRRRTPVRSGPYNRVLLFGRNRELALYRAEVLKNEIGCTVAIPRNKEEAVDAIERGDIDAVILSYTLSSSTVEELAELLRQTCRECPLIIIAQSRTADPKIDPDAVVLADDGPKALIPVVQRALHRKLQ